MKTARILWQGKTFTAQVDADVLTLADGLQIAFDDLTSKGKWLPPVNPGTIFALGLNYADHAKELAFNQAPEKPLVFLKGRNALTGHASESVRPADVTFMHYECELAVVIGTGGKNIDEAQALEHVSGYTIANDYAFRDYLENYERPNLRVKNRDACTPLGPWLVSADEIADPMKLALTTRVNGEITQQGTTADMIFSVPALISYLSSVMTLSPGDVILTGTPHGVVDCKVGDVVSTEIEGLGKLVNTIVAPPEPG
ncbi:MAG: fumarylacetoacetate hydrolase family protein [Burkholderiaceae bacterium]